MKSLRTDSRRKYYTPMLAVFCNILWGSAPAGLKTAYRLFAISSDSTSSQILFTGIRFTLAGIIILIFLCLMRRKMVMPGRTDLLPIIKIAVVQTVLQYIFCSIGVANSTGVKTSILLGSGSFFSIIISTLILRQEEIRFNKLLGCIIGFMGIIVINISGKHGDGFRFIGEGLIISANIMWAIGSCMTKKITQTVDPAILTAYQFIFGGIIILLIGTASGGTLTPVSNSAWLVLVYLALVSSVAYVIWTRLLKDNDVSHITIYNFVNPIAGVILSSLILKEGKTFSIIQMIFSIALVCAGIIIVNKPVSNKTDKGL